MVMTKVERTAFPPPRSINTERAPAAENTTWRLDKGNAPNVASLPSLRVFSGGLAHNFNNLLTVISGNAALMRRQLPADSPSLSMLDQIETVVQRAENIVRQMMLYAQKCGQRLEVLNLSRLLEEAGEQFQSSVPGDVFVEYNLSPDLPLVRGDWGQLRRLVTSLLHNAAEAMADKPGVIRVQARACHADRAFLADVEPDQELPEGRYVWLKISDDGCGMDDETRQHLFEPFFTTKFIGRGLGLSAGLGIVRQHRGAIWVAGNADKGTTVHILLPCA
jgi:two-component system cell cycle sensor histidine kinase/response regulator CckA